MRKGYRFRYSLGLVQLEHYRPAVVETVTLLPLVTGVYRRYSRSVS